MFYRQCLWNTSKHRWEVQGSYSLDVSSWNTRTRNRIHIGDAPSLRIPALQGASQTVIKLNQPLEHTITQSMLLNWISAGELMSLRRRPPILQPLLLRLSLTQLLECRCLLLGCFRRRCNLRIPSTAHAKWFLLLRPTRATWLNYKFRPNLRRHFETKTSCFLIPELELTGSCCFQPLQTSQPCLNACTGTLMEPSKAHLRCSNRYSLSTGSRTNGLCH